MKVDMQKFGWAEMFNDSKGRTSPGKVVGFTACVVSCLVFLLCGVTVISKYNEGPNVQSLATQAVVLFGLGGGLLGIRRFTKDKELENKVE